MDILEALDLLQVDQTKILSNRIQHTRQAMREMPELADHIRPILEDQLAELNKLFED